MTQLIDPAVLDQTLAGLIGSGHWYVGFSGGVDSTVLLHLLQRWRKANAGAPPLTAVHINHDIQDEAQEWESHCSWICEFLQVPFVSETVTVNEGSRGIEAAAREARYKVFEDLLQRGDVLFLGHHLDDQVETFFLRLLRGSGVRGLAAMPAARSLGVGQLVRPLLNLSREQLEAYASQHGLNCIEDPSNADCAMDRNYLRQQVMPLLARRWPGYRQTVNRASEHMAHAADTLEAMVETPQTSFSPVGDPGFAAAQLEGQPQEFASLQLRLWLRSGGYQAPDQLALTEFLRQLRESRDDASPQLQTGDYTLRRYLDTVYLAAVQTEPKMASIALHPGDSCEVAQVGRVILQPCDGPGIWLAPGEELELRWRSGGERCRPVGRDRSSSLKKLLQEYQVPPWWRSRIPLLYAGEELLAVGDLWPCQSSRFGEGGRQAERCYELVWEATIPAGFD